MKHQPVIGLEIHCELLTKSKIFCFCKNGFGGDANTRTCPVCTGMPGSLPVLNRNAVSLAVKAGLISGCTINKYSLFERKNYFYPDSPKAYQITQLRHPICSGGYIDLTNGNRIRINRIQLEEDAGKLIHQCGISMIDYNRCGVPLIEIVTEPDFSTPEEVAEFIKQLSLRLKYADVCDCRMEQGSLRVDVNISLTKSGTSELGARTEIKNLNSVKAITAAINYEIKRQSELLDNGEKPNRQTCRFDEASGTTISLRTKEEADDYRYFPEPDLPPVTLTDDDITLISRSLPEPPQERIRRYTGEYGLSYEAAVLITAQKAFSDFYDCSVKLFPDYKLTAKLMLGEVSRCINTSGMNISSAKFTPSELAEAAGLLASGKISNNSAKEIISIMFYSGGNPTEIAHNNGYIISDDTDSVIRAADEVMKNNHELVVQYRNGEEKLFGYIMGQTMRKCGKNANPALVKKVLTEKLKEI